MNGAGSFLKLNELFASVTLKMDGKTVTIRITLNHFKNFKLFDWQGRHSDGAYY